MPVLERPPGPATGVLHPVQSFRALRAFRQTPLGFLRQMREQYGDLCYFQIGPQHMYLVSEPALIQEILVNQAGNFIKSRVLQKARSLLGDGLLTNEGAPQLRQRRLVQPAFHRDRMLGYGRVMSTLAMRERDRWSHGQTQDIHAAMMRLTLAIVGETLFSTDVEQKAPEVGEALTTFVSLFDRLMLPWFELLMHLPTRTAREVRGALDVLDRIIYGVIESRRADPTDRGDLLSMLMLADDPENPGERMSDVQVRDEALTLFLAGHETTANALTWTWYLLSKHPEVEARFHAEIDAVLTGGRAVTPEDVSALKYTEHVFAEALRLYPPAWALGRMAKADFTLGEHRIPAGSILLMSPAVTQRDPRWFPEPDQFRPERWADPAFKPPKFAYFPFGGGARVCIGERFAWMEGILLLAAIGQRWRLRQDPADAVVEELAQVTLRPRGGLPMLVEARSGHF
jgi:cytochrome P450